MNTNSQPPGRLRLRVSAAAERQLRSGHPWVFEGSIREQSRQGMAGELAVIYDRQDRFLAVGLFDPESPIRLRVLQAGKPQAVTPEFWASRLKRAAAARNLWFDEATTGYRLINGESDGWPGLVLDRYDKTLVVKIYTAAWLPWLDVVLPLIREHINPERVVLRWSRNIRMPTYAESPVEAADGRIVFGPPLNGPVVFRETGILFEADVLRGQKTGFFLDQRENRRRVEILAHGRSVLNAFSFSGGFSLYAARGGAASVADLDISEHALASAKRNFALNASDPRIASCRHESIQADTFEWLNAGPPRAFDMVVLDPPSFAKRESERAGAVRAYERLAMLGLRHLKSGGILLACSCSAHVSPPEFFDAIRSAGRKSGRTCRELETALHAQDHPAAFKEAEYLKAIYLRAGAA